MEQIQLEEVDVKKQAQPQGENPANATKTKNKRTRKNKKSQKYMMAMKARMTVFIKFATVSKPIATWTSTETTKTYCSHFKDCLNQKRETGVEWSKAIVR